VQANSVKGGGGVGVDQRQIVTVQLHGCGGGDGKRGCESIAMHPALPPPEATKLLPWLLVHRSSNIHDNNYDRQQDQLLSTDYCKPASIVTTPAGHNI